MADDMSHFQLQFPADRHDTAGDAFVDTSLGNAADAEVEMKAIG